MGDFYIYVDDYDYDDTLGPGTELQRRRVRGRCQGLLKPIVLCMSMLDLDQQRGRAS